MKDRVPARSWERKQPMIRVWSSWRPCVTRQTAVVAAALSLLACSEALLDPDGESKRPDNQPRPNQPAIAFVSTRNGSPHIYVADADGSHVAPLTSGRSPAWSWDGRRLAFVRAGDDGIPGDLYVIDSDGSNERRITSGALSAAWSPDGRISFHSTLPWSTDASQDGIWVVNPDGTGRRLLLAHAWAKEFNAAPGYGIEAVQFPTWSPGGQSVAFWLYGGYMGHRGVGLMNPDGSNPRHLQTGLSTWGPIAWSPDGSRITFSVPIPAGIMSVPVTGSAVPETHYYARAERFQHELDWSPDGRHIVFSEGGRFPDESRRIFALSLETGEVRQLIPNATNPSRAPYDDREPVWARTRR